MDEHAPYLRNLKTNQVFGYTELLRQAHPEFVPCDTPTWKPPEPEPQPAKAGPDAPENREEPETETKERRGEERRKDDGIWPIGEERREGKERRDLEAERPAAGFTLYLKYNKWPKYKCYKEVRALKIVEIVPEVRAVDESIVGATITPEEGFPSFEVDAEYMKKHSPEVGGYYVVYADGYKSFSPAKAFEEGYSKIYIY